MPQKILKMDGTSVTMDRLSDLPDQLLTNILTLLPTEEAIRTCILSKRWINVWTSMPILVFHDHKDMDDDLTDEDFLERDIEFMEFVYGALVSRKNLPLDTFKLTWCSKFTETFSIMSGILSYTALRLLPRVLSFYADNYGTFDLPGSIFTCVSVEEMSLAVNCGGYLDYIEAESISLPRLKKLELGFMMFNDDFIRMLLSGCPVLEELVFSDCTFDIDEISSSVLKKLTMKQCHPINNIQISCPGVVSLDINVCDLPGITLKRLPSLITANFQFATTFNTVFDDMKLLNGLSNVASLRFSTDCTDIMDLLAADTLNCPDLCNLKSLDFGYLDMNLHGNLVLCLLQHSPILEVLALHFFQVILAADILNFRNLNKLNNLKSLKLGGLAMKLHWNLVVCLLEHSPNLETFTLDQCQDLFLTDTLNCPTLNNLKNLDLGRLDMNHWNLVVCLLQHSPKLETLTLFSSQHSEDATKEELLGDVSFQLEYLKTMKIRAYKTNEKYAEYVVRNLSVFIKSIGEVIVDLK